MRTLRVLLLSLAGCSMVAVGRPLVETERLRLSFTDRGTVESLHIGASPFPLAGPGGFRLTEYERTVLDPPRLLHRVRPGTMDTPGFVPVDMMQPSDKAAAIVHPRETDDVDEPFVRVGATEKYGHGMWITDAAKAQPGAVCRLNWEGRIPDKTANFIIYVRVYDDQGRDITQSASPPASWTYSPYTQTHYRHLIAPDQPAVWQRLNVTYQLPDDVHSLKPAICLFRGKYADVRNVTLEQTARVVHTPIEIDESICLAHDDGVLFRLRSRSAALRLEAEARTIDGTVIRTDFDLIDLSEPLRPRAVIVSFSLPVSLAGWSWWRDWQQSERVGESTERYSHTAALAGHSVSLYPFSAVTRGRMGLAMGVPLDRPVIERRVVARSGISTQFDMGLCPGTRVLGPGAAEGTFLLYAFDGRWGFRAAAAHFRQAFPDHFSSRAEREGLWMLAMAPSDLPADPGDFGFAFWEGWSANADEQALAEKLGIAILPYTEAWGIRQFFRDAESAAELPSPEACKAILETWAAEKAVGKTWLGMPRSEAATAVLRSLPVQPDGSHPYSVDKYGTWAHWWRTNPDPKLPTPNRASICWDHRITPRLEACDGVYLDSVSANTAGYLNVRPDHLAIVKQSLTFDYASGKPAMPGMIHQVAFVRWLAQRLHTADKLIQANLFGISHRYHSHLVDIIGSEVGSSGLDRRLYAVESDSTCCLRRFYGYRKPVVNLLQEGNYRKPVPALSHEQVRHYIEHQAFYGFYPSISTAGGEKEAGYRNWKRYFKSPELVERDRDCFREFVPVVRQLNQAGWEPVTGMRFPDGSGVRAERFGTEPGNLFVTLRNPGNQQVAVEAVLESDTLALGDVASLQARDVITGDAMSFHRLPTGDWQLSLSLGPRSTRILKVD